MDAATAAEDLPAEPAPGSSKPRRRKLLLFVLPPVALLLLVAGLWFTGVLPGLLGLGQSAGGGKQAADVPPVYVDIPEIVTNLGGGARRQNYVKFHAKVELARAQDAAAVQTLMPRLLDMFQTYIREVRPEELRDAAGTYRIREELIARADIALAPVHISDILFVELLVQ
ncbi:MAG TPA: flagellar basal body-associated FliL family protein [Acidisphaera sp.]|nr:flagellar basal body-associated FliL family protein [Acidisphaera sp.]